MAQTPPCWIRCGGLSFCFAYAKNYTTPALKDHHSLFMRIASYGLSKAAIEHFLRGQQVPESLEEDAEAEFEHLTNLLLDLKNNQFVKKKPYFPNITTPEGKTAFLLGAEALVKNKNPIGSQVQIIHQLSSMHACPLLKDRKGSDAANLVLTKSKDQ
eukprot:scaffold153528_cov43-Prasinocladus_malaysianus.AAC.1